MRKFLAALILAAIPLCTLLYAQERSPIDLVLVLDTSTNMSASFREGTDYISGPFLRDNLRLGDTFHLISFSGTARLELARRIEGTGDLETIIARMFLMYPLDSEANVSAALSYTESYLSTLPVNRPKKVFFLSGGEENGASGLIAAAAPRLGQRGGTIEFMPASRLPQAAALPRTVPAQTVPAQTTPAVSTPVQPAVSAQTAPAVSTPTTPGQTTSAQPVPAAPVQTAPAASAPTTPARTTPAQTTPVQPAAPAQTAPAASAPTTPARTTPAQTTPVQPAAPAQTAPAASTPATPAQTAPVQPAAPAQTAPVTPATSAPAQTAQPADRTSSGNTQTSRQPREGETLRLSSTPVLIILGVLLAGILIFTIRQLSGRLRRSPNRVLASASKPKEPGKTVETAPKRARPPVKTETPINKPEAPINRPKPEPGRPQPSSRQEALRFHGEPLMVSLFVEDQSTSIGRRNIHMLKQGNSLAVGGGKSDFLIFLVPLPPAIAELRYDGRRCGFVPRKPQFFPDLSASGIPDCIGETIRIISEKNYELRIRFELYEDPLQALNRLLNSLSTPG